VQFEARDGIIRLHNHDFVATKVQMTLSAGQSPPPYSRNVGSGAEVKPRETGLIQTRLGDGAITGFRKNSSIAAASMVTRCQPFMQPSAEYRHIGAIKIPFQRR
jgi:hypothetical protein